MLDFSICAICAKHQTPQANPGMLRVLGVDLGVFVFLLWGCVCVVWGRNPRALGTHRCVGVGGASVCAGPASEWSGGASVCGTSYGEESVGRVSAMGMHLCGLGGAICVLWERIGAVCACICVLWDCVCVLWWGHLCVLGMHLCALGLHLCAPAVRQSAARGAMAVHREAAGWCDGTTRSGGVGFFCAI